MGETALSSNEQRRDRGGAMARGLVGLDKGKLQALIIFVILIFSYAFKMNKADADYGVREETG
jgi:hypothetical protein